MAVTHARCERSPKVAALSLVTVYVPPGTIKTLRLCAECAAVAKKLAEKKGEVRK